MKKFVSVLLVFILMFSMVLTGCSSSSSTTPNDSQQSQGTDKKEEPQKDMPKFVKIAGATSGGTYFLLANALAQLFNEKIPGINASAQSTAGSPKILELLNTGGGELGIAQAGVADDAYNGKGSFEGKAMKNISQIAYFYPNVMQLIVRKDSGIKSLTDLKGSNFGVGAVGGATELNSKDLVAALGYSYPGDITPEYTSESQSVELLKNKQLDAANMIAALGSSTMLDLMSTGDYEILPIDKSIVDKLHNEVNKAYFAYTIPANTYPNQPEPVESYAVANWLHARGDVSEDFVYEVLTVLYDNLDYMHNAHKITTNISLENALNGQTIPLHPGAVKFYKDKGIDVKQ